MTSRRKKGAAAPAATQRGAGRRPGIEPAGAENPGPPRRRILVHVYRDRRGLWAQVEGPDGQVARAFRGQPTLQQWPERLRQAALRFRGVSESWDSERWWHDAYTSECARLWRLAALPIERVSGEAEVTEAEEAAGGRIAVESVALLPERPKPRCACGGYLQARYPSLIAPPPDGKRCAYCRWNLTHDPGFNPAEPFNPFRPDPF